MNPQFPLPEYDDYSIKHIESIGDVSKGTLSDDFQEHFHSKNSRKHDVTGLHDDREFWRLIVILDAH